MGRAWCRRRRFTPTRVGTSAYTGTACTGASVHPHACGDIVGLCAINPTGIGSPPRVWGHPEHVLDVLHPDRFTPTRVGTSSPISLMAHAFAVHPHACGDISLKTRPLSTRCGSPPRVWGHPHDTLFILAIQRFTPTRVGTSLDLKDFLLSSAVHPHACGDIACSLARYTFHAVHPHACGDIVKPLQLRAVEPGSPPRVWGHLAMILLTPLHNRFTPTRVGTSLLAEADASGDAVHPHACGDIGANVSNRK